MKKPKSLLGALVLVLLSAGPVLRSRTFAQSPPSISGSPASPSPTSDAAPSTSAAPLAASTSDAAPSTPAAPLAASTSDAAPSTSAAPLAAPTHGPAPNPPAAPLAAPPQASEAAPTFAVAAGRGITATSADKKFAITLRSRVQLRTTLTAHEERDEELEASLKTLRFAISGYALVPELKYLIQLAFGAGDYEKDNASPVFDAFVEYTAIRDLNVRVGQYFVPFDRARTIREFALQLIDRQGVVRELNLDRDFGLMLSSADLFGLGGRLGYNLFVGSGDGRNRVLDSKNAHGPQQPGVLLVARLTLRPFGPFDDDLEGDLTRSASPHLALGLAGAYNLASDRDKSTYGATYSAGTFDYTHAAADLVFKWHGFSLLSEVLYRDANKATNTRNVAGGAPVVESSRSGVGYFVQAGQMLTNTLELTGRWEELFAKKGTDAALRDATKYNGRQAGGGLNLYLNGHFFKLQTDYFYIFGVREGRASHLARVQLDASF